MIEFNSRIDEKIMQNLTKVYEAVADFAHLPKRIKVNLSFVDEKTIRKLNKDTRNIDKVTDVLTYPYVELRPKEKLKLSDYELEMDPDDNRLLIGDIYICIATERNEPTYIFIITNCFKKSKRIFAFA